jgi:hypothetical protein
VNREPAVEAAAHLDRTHTLSRASMASVVAYARGEYAQDLLKGRQCELN